MRPKHFHLAGFFFRSGFCGNVILPANLAYLDVLQAFANAVAHEPSRMIGVLPMLTNIPVADTIRNLLPRWLRRYSKETARLD